MLRAARPHSSTSSSVSDSRAFASAYAEGFTSRSVRTASAARRRLKRAMTFVYRLSFTTVVYSSGPVTPWMWKVLPSSLRQKPRSAQSRAVSTNTSMPSRSRNSTSPVAPTYWLSAYAMSASMWYCAVPAA